MKHRIPLKRNVSPSIKHCNEQEIQYLKEAARVTAAFSARYFPGSDDRARPAAARGVLGRLPVEPLSRAQALRT